MRTKFELILVVLFLTLTWRLAYGDMGFKCGGAYDCKLVNCYDAGKEGYSCALVTAVTLKKCEPANPSDECTKVNKKCALVTYYSGGTCDNNTSPYCDGMVTMSTKDLLQDGCN